MAPLQKFVSCILLGRAAGIQQEERFSGWSRALLLASIMNKLDFSGVYRPAACSRMIALRAGSGSTIRSKQRLDVVSIVGIFNYTYQWRLGVDDRHKLSLLDCTTHHHHIAFDIIGFIYIRSLSLTREPRTNLRTSLCLLLLMAIFYPQSPLLSTVLQLVYLRTLLCLLLLKNTRLKLDIRNRH